MQEQFKSDKEKFVVKEVMPFPAINWWLDCIDNPVIYLNTHEIYKKEKPLNRYTLTASQGVQLMSIPLKGGRNQKKIVEEVMISYDMDWNSHHWKTMQSMYRKSPFFEFYERELEFFYESRPDSLFEWNKKSIELMIQLLGLKTEVKEWRKDEVLGTNIVSEAESMPPLKYHQVFKDRVPFQPNCSILDLLFCEGNNSLYLLRQHALASRASIEAVEKT